MAGYHQPTEKLALVLLAVFLLGEDVERPSTIVEPPPEGKPRQETPLKPPAEQTRLQNKPIPPRHRLDLSGPRRLHLEPRPSIGLPEDVNREITEAERVKSRIEGYFLDILARRRVKMGQVDHGWYYLARRIEHRWSPDFSLVHESGITEVSGPWLRSIVWDWLEGWYRSASHTRSDGITPLDDDLSTRLDTTLLDLQRIAAQENGYGALVTTLVEIRIGATEGPSASLVASSGHPFFDRAAMGAVQSSLENLDERELPHKPSRSIYAVTARYAILPPLPVVGFAFDIMLGYFDLFYPLKKMVNGKVMLVAVYRTVPTDE